MSFFVSKSPEERKRILEFFAVFFTSLILFGLSRLETRLFSLSETLSANKEFFTTLIYFALINLNVILILFLSFLIFRNVTRLIIERRRGVIGSKLRTKLVFSLVFFALAPTLLLFYVSMKYITTSFDTWFSEKVKVAMQETKEVGSLVYEQDQKRLQSLARIALQRIRINSDEEMYDLDVERIDVERLSGFENEYGINAVKIFKPSGVLAWNSLRGWGSDIPEKSDHYVRIAIDQFIADPGIKGLNTVSGEVNQDIVKGIAPIRDDVTGQLIGVLVTEVHFESQILKSIGKIIKDFGDLKPGAQLIRMSYMILMIVMTLLIVFSAIWMGFFVARGITGPIQSLAGATREIALGNYNISLKAKSNDETGQLVNAFNLMARDLREHEKNTEQAKSWLQRSNEELEQKKQYMEIVLKHMTAGVISLDSHFNIGSINAAAEKFLKLNAAQVMNLNIVRALPAMLQEHFWQPIYESLLKRKSFSGQLDLGKMGYDVNLMVNASLIFDDQEEEIGVVIVFDDADEQARAQRAAAWREVARRIAHEIKNPITPIKLNAQRLLRKFKSKFTDIEDATVFEGCLETIINQVDSLRDLVNEFSKFSRLPRIKPERLFLQDIISEVTKLFSMSYPDIHLEVAMIREEDIPEVLIDKEQMNRCFINILTNSVASMNKMAVKNIRITVEPLFESQVVKIIFADNGCGIPKDLQKRVLEPYFSTKSEGTGLGLAIVNQIISEHGGYLRIHSIPGKGTEIIIEIPISTYSA